MSAKNFSSAGLNVLASFNNLHGAGPGVDLHNLGGPGQGGGD